MTLLTALITFYICLYGIILLHELGHGIAASHYGKRVLGYQIGWGRVGQYAPDKSNQIRFGLIPVMGSCTIPDFHKCTSVQKLVISAAGPVATALSALVFWGANEALALMTLEFALLNLLPFPGLDGGHIYNALKEMVNGTN